MGSLTFEGLLYSEKEEETGEENKRNSQRSRRYIPLDISQRWKCVSRKLRKGSISRESRTSDAVVSPLFVFVCLFGWLVGWLVFSREEATSDFGNRKFGEEMGVEERLWVETID